MQNAKILFVIDKVEFKYFEFNKLVTDFWLIYELLIRGYEVFVTRPDKLSLKNSVAFCKAHKSFLGKTNGNDDIFLTNESEDYEIEDFSLVMFRPDPPVDLDYINATYVFDFVDKQKTLVLNNTRAIRDFNEKVHANLFVDLMPKNIVTANKKDILEFLNENDEIILKPLNRCFGAGVMYLKKDDKNINAIINSMTNNENTLIMVQKYIASEKFGDKRVLILDGEVLDECVVKLPSGNDFKFNTHSDEFIKKGALSTSEKSKFEIVAQKLKELGIVMAGLDVIDEQIIEINVTSPCYFIKEINNYFCVEIEKKIVDSLLKLTDYQANKLVSPLSQQTNQ